MAKHKPNYEFKAKVLNEYSNLISRYKQSSQFEFAVKQLEETGVICYTLEHLNPDVKTISELGAECANNDLVEEFREVIRINHADLERALRLKKRISSMLENGSNLFLTLTFNDDTLNSTTQKERRVAVSRFLKSFGVPYVANIDFGKLNGREHYHAVLNTDNIDLKSWRKYGNINVERIKSKNLSRASSKISKYVSKLTNHSIKTTTQRQALIYSR